MTEQAKVPAIRFAGFTDPWEQRKLGEIADKVTEKNLDGNITEVLTNSAEYGVINQTEFFDHAVAKESNIAGYYVIAPGDFVYNPRISATAPVGPIRRNTLGIHGVMSPLYTVFRLTDAVDGTYLSHFFKTNGWHGFMKLEGNSGARSDRFSIGDATFFEMPIPVPSSSEQHAIGSFFSRLDDLITLHQRKYDKLVIFKKSMLEKMFPKDGESVPEIRFAGFTDPWEQRKLGELALTYSGGTPSAGNSAYYGGEIPFIRSAEIDCDSTELSLTVAGLNNSSAKLVDKGMVLYAMYGATSGEVAISKIKGAINQAILAMDASDMAANRFIAYWLRRQKKSITETFLQGGQGNLSGAIIKELGIPQPSLDEQRQIGSFFSNLDDLITLHQRKLELLQNIKKSLLDKMFV
ncbi:restriction endonuclease subunit S [Bifidobacterium longum]|uniref:restriction endonuclease subunit S n=1 Tax=Bifidobacterium longum TaxID=216816 RepID=UPI0007188354|nr:restriction endonuclease S subunit [Bifidobacterium longum subsp. longum]